MHTTYARLYNMYGETKVEPSKPDVYYAFQLLMSYWAVVRKRSKNLLSSSQVLQLLS